MAGKPKSGIGSGSGTNANRTPSGGVSAKARAATGSGKNKSYPMPDQKAALDAINMRGQGNSMSRQQVLAKASQYAREHKDPKVAKAVAAARAEDAKRGK